MKITSKYTLALLSCFLFTKVYPQEKQIIAKASVKKSEILLRWAPSDKELWRIGLENGYRILRVELSVARAPVEADFVNAVVLTQAPVKPYSKNDTLWMKAFRSDKNAYLVYKALHENSSSTTAEQKQGQEEMLYGLSLLSADMNAETAKATGFYFKDSLISNKKTYAYKIELANLPAGMKVKAGYVLADASAITMHPPVNTLKGKFAGKTASLSWNAYDVKNDYSCFIIERSEDSIRFSRVNKAPVMWMATDWEKNKKQIFYMDTVPETEKKYFYRIIGVDHFGGTGPASVIIAGIAYEEVKGFPLLDSVLVLKDGSVKLRWRLSQPGEENKLKGFIVQRSKTIHGKYEMLEKNILIPSANTYTDQSLTTSSYYKITAIGKGGDSVSSYPSLALVYDATAPAAPLGLKGTINANGKIKLSWNNNPENDLKGYRVFRSNSMEEEFVEVTKQILARTGFEDSVKLNTLTKEMYYKVNAVDASYNNSVFSPAIKMERPDTIAPVPVVLKEAYSGKSGIDLAWINSSSKDVINYYLYKWKEGEKEKTMKEWTPADTLQKYRDTAVVPGAMYHYKIICSDASDNFSVSNTVTVVFENGMRKKLNTLQAETNRELKSITLNWQYKEPEVYSYVIYKAKKGEVMRSYKTLSPEENMFTDTTLYINTLYIYRVKAVFKNGAESFSDIVEVEF